MDGHQGWAFLVVGSGDGHGYGWVLVLEAWETVAPELPAGESVMCS